MTEEDAMGLVEAIRDYASEKTRRIRLGVYNEDIEGDLLTVLDEIKRMD